MTQTVDVCTISTVQTIDLHVRNFNVALWRRFRAFVTARGERLRDVLAEAITEYMDRRERSG